MKQEQAGAIAVKVLEWMARDDEMLMAFLGWSGADISGLRDAVQNPEFLGALLDFLMQDEATLMAFCDQAGIGYTDIGIARAALPGGEQLHWT